MSRGIENVRTKLGAVATAVAVVLLAGGAAQAYPIAGIFESEEFPGGDVMDGRWSESLPEGDTDSLCQIGSIINAASWDGDKLGTQWQMSQQRLVSANPVHEEDLGALRIETWVLGYEGGELVLGKDARIGTSKWWGGEPVDTEYLVDITNYSHTTQIHYLGDTVAGVYSIISLTGMFDQSKYAGYEVEFMLAVAVQLDDGATPPDDFPDYLFGDYPDPEQWGQWGIAQKIKMEITPEPSTVGLLALGGILVLVRRRRQRRMILAD